MFVKISKLADEVTISVNPLIDVVLHKGGRFCDARGSVEKVIDHNQQIRCERWPKLME